MTDAAWFDTIEWWENDSGKFNWHAKNSGNQEIIFGSVQGYEDKSEMIRYLSANFPNCALVPRDGEPRSSSEVESERLATAPPEEGAPLDQEERVHEDDGA